MTTSGGMQGGSRHWRAASSAACASHTSTAAVARLWSCAACPDSRSSPSIASTEGSDAVRGSLGLPGALLQLADHMLTALTMHSRDLPPTQNGTRTNQDGGNMRPQLDQR